MDHGAGISYDESIECMNTHSLAIVIPTYNEAENISAFIDALLKKTTAHLIIVDDSSPDGTTKIVEQKNNKRITLIVRKEKNGLGSAYRAGFDYALLHGYTIIGQMDADFSHAPLAVKSLIEGIKENTLVLGSRHVKGGQIIGWNFWRHFCSKSAMVASRVILRLDAKDVTTGFRFWSADLLAKVLGQQIASTGYAFQEELLFHAQQLGGEIIERPIVFRDREEGKSKLGWKDVVEFFIVLAKLRLRKKVESRK